MPPMVYTKDGVLAASTLPGSANDMTQDQATADCVERNKRAEELGISTRYEVREGVRPEK